MIYAVKNISDKITCKRQCVRVPGSKSITARAMLLAALAEGNSTLYGAQMSDDCATFFEALRSLGIEAESNGGAVNISGCNCRLPKRKASLYVGSAGTAARFLTALCAFSDGEYHIDCSAQMKSRPQEPLIKALQGAGAHFTFDENPYCFPFTVRGNRDIKKCIEVDIGKSSQYLSALLMCAPCTGGKVSIKPTGGHGMDYVNMTIDMMWSFGVNVERRGDIFEVCGSYSAKKYDIEPDVSAACYFYAINKILGTDISVSGIMPHTLQGDYKFIELLRTFDGGEVDMSSFSDQALTLAAIAPYFSSPTIITGIAHTRGQECDRIKAACAALSAMGVKAEEREDGLKIYPSQPKPALIKTCGDHRVAMSFALTGLRADGIEIEDAEVCSKTFAEYFTVLDDVISRLTK